MFEVSPSANTDEGEKANEPTQNYTYRSDNATKRTAARTVCAVCSQDGDDEESKPENGVDNIEDHVRLRTRPALKPLYMSSDNLVNEEDGGLQTDGYTPGV